MSKPIIAVDLDDVLAANAVGFIRYSNERWGTSLTLDDYDEHWRDMWKLDQAEVEKRASDFFASGTIGRYKHDPQAKKALDLLKKRYTLVILTSRRRLLEKETFAWLDTYFKDVFDEIYFTNIWDNPDTQNRHKITKANVCKEIGAKYLIDDQLKHCLGAAEVGISSLLYGDYPWNQAEELPEGVTRCKDWQEVLEYFDAQG